VLCDAVSVLCYDCSLYRIVLFLCDEFARVQYLCCMILFLYCVTVSVCCVFLYDAVVQLGAFVAGLAELASNPHSRIMPTLPRHYHTTVIGTRDGGGRGGAPYRWGA
jgi:hypothetical protein